MRIQSISNFISPLSYLNKKTQLTIKFMMNTIGSQKYKSILLSNKTRINIEVRLRYLYDQTFIITQKRHKFCSFSLLMIFF